MRHALFVALNGAAIATVTCAVAISQDRATSRDGSKPDDPLRGFSIKDGDDIDLVIRGREQAIAQCMEVLRTSAPRKAAKDGPRYDLKVERAVGLLGKLDAERPECVASICRNLALYTEGVSFSEDSNDPLLLRPAARALVTIGGREAAEGVIRHMKQELDRGELLICAHILNQNDYHRVTFERLRIAKEQARLEEPQEVREIFFHNLAQVQQWIEDPGFESDPKFRP